MMMFHVGNSYAKIQRQESRQEGCPRQIGSIPSLLSYEPRWLVSEMNCDFERHIYSFKILFLQSKYRRRSHPL